MRDSKGTSPKLSSTEKLSARCTPPLTVEMRFSREASSSERQAPNVAAKSATNSRLLKQVSFFFIDDIRCATHQRGGISLVSKKTETRKPHAVLRYSTVSLATNSFCNCGAGGFAHRFFGAKILILLETRNFTTKNLHFCATTPP